MIRVTPSFHLRPILPKKHNHLKSTVRRHFAQIVSELHVISMIHHLYIIPALMEEWGVAEYSVHTQLYTDPDRTGLTMTIHVILNTVHVNVKLQRRPLSFFTLLKRPSLFLKHRHPACTHAVNMRVRRRTRRAAPTVCACPPSLNQSINLPTNKQININKNH